MLVDGHRRHLPNSTEWVLSPVTLDHAWPTLARLVAVVLCSAIGSITNVYFISSFAKDRYLRHISKLYLVCTGVSDLIVSFIVLPIMGTVLISGQWDNYETCKFIQFFVELSTYTYNVFFALAGSEAYYRLCRPLAEYNLFLAIKVIFVTVTVYVCCVIVASVGVFMHLDYDYCTRLSQGNRVFRISTFCLLQVLPSFLSIYTIFSTSCYVKRRGRTDIHYRRSDQYDRDRSDSNVYIAAYMLYLVLWMPYLIIVHKYPNADAKTYYYTAWIAVLRSAFGSFVYFGISRVFRRWFISFYRYCFCKIELADDTNERPNKNKQSGPPIGEVRVHIMQQPIVSSPVRAATSPREAYEL